MARGVSRSVIIVQLEGEQDGDLRHSHILLERGVVSAQRSRPWSQLSKLDHRAERGRVHVVRHDFSFDVSRLLFLSCGQDRPIACIAMGRQHLRYGSRAPSDLYQGNNRPRKSISFERGGPETFSPWQISTRVTYRTIQRSESVHDDRISGKESSWMSSVRWMSKVWKRMCWQAVVRRSS